MYFLNIYREIFKYLIYELDNIIDRIFFDKKFNKNKLTDKNSTRRISNNPVNKNKELFKYKDVFSNIKANW